MPGAQLRVQREFLGFSRAQLAQILDITPGVIADWENGRDATPYHLPDAMDAIFRFTDEYLKTLADAYRAGETVLTYRTDAAYCDHHPNPMYTASWHRQICARLLHDNPRLRIEFHGD
jgi:transcriptional regulator with XRE-family HTH domain